MADNKFASDVKKAFSAVHKDIQNMKNLFDKLNKKVDIIGEQVDFMKKAIVKISEETPGDVPPDKPAGFDEAGEAVETESESESLYSS